MSDSVKYAEENAQAWMESINEMLTDIDNAEDTEAEFDARQTLIESPLEVKKVKSYEILLSTGGPALRIVGELDYTYDEPYTARLEFQNWGIPWTPFPLNVKDEDALLRYARSFGYFDGRDN